MPNTISLTSMLKQTITTVIGLSLLYACNNYTSKPKAHNSHVTHMDYLDSTTMNQYIDGESCSGRIYAYISEYTSAVLIKYKIHTLVSDSLYTITEATRDVNFEGITIDQFSKEDSFLFLDYCSDIKNINSNKKSSSGEKFSFSIIKQPINNTDYLFIEIDSLNSSRIALKKIKFKCAFSTVMPG